MAVEKAKSYIGVPYNVFTDNCEHFVRLCHGLEKESTQLQKYLIMALGVGIGLKSENKVFKAAGYGAAIASFMSKPEISPKQDASFLSLLFAGIALLSESNES